MLEIFLLIMTIGAYRETAKRRGTKGWPFMVVGVLGWLILGNLGVLLFGPGLHWFLSWGWVGLTYLAIFLIGGGGRRRKDTWQCPDCRSYNPPSTLVCLCGHDPAKVDEPVSAIES